MGKLALTRKLREKLIFTVPPGTEPTMFSIEVCEVRGMQVRLMTEAPDRVTVDREEVHLKKVGGVVPPAPWTQV